MTKPCLTCDLCGRVFNYTGAKSNHRWVHEKKTKCPDCPVTVTRPSDLRRHKKTCMNRVRVKITNKTWYLLVTLCFLVTHKIHMGENWLRWEYVMGENLWGELMRGELIRVRIDGWEFIGENCPHTTTARIYPDMPI